MAIPTITALPTAPVRSDSTTFESRADALMTALPTMVTEINTTTAAITTDANAAVSAAAASASAAASSAGAAAASEAAALASSSSALSAAGITKWISGASYVLGDVVWSPSSYYSYRAKGAVSGATDPSADGANWALIAGAAFVSPARLFFGIN